MCHNTCPIVKNVGKPPCVSIYLQDHNDNDGYSYCSIIAFKACFQGP